MADLLSQLIREVAEQLRSAGVEFKAETIESRLRAEWGGERVYIGKTSVDAIRHVSNRDRAILRDWQHGEHVPVLARRYGLSARRVQQIVRPCETNCLNDFAAPAQSLEHDRTHDRPAAGKTQRRRLADPDV